MSLSMIAGVRQIARNGAMLKQVRCMGSSTEEIKMLEKLLSEAKGREAGEQQKVSEDVGEVGPKFVVGTYNAISPEGLAVFPKNRYEIAGMASEENKDVEPHCLVVRSYKLDDSNVPDTVRCIGRAGSGTNNIQITKAIPVFNAPGANANSVKESALCGLLLASRGVVAGINHIPTIIEEENEDWPKIKKRVESDKKLFAGREVAGKKLAVIGLGHIGSSLAESASIGLGMEVIGYDPSISVDNAWRLPGHIMDKASSIQECVADADYVSLHVPYMKETHHLISGEILKKMKPGAHIVNFARGELVDSAAMRELMESGERTGRYVSDFVDENLHGLSGPLKSNIITLPHLGASTSEAESNAARNVSQSVLRFIETGEIINSVNFPTCRLGSLPDAHTRLCVIHHNVPGALALLTQTLAKSKVNILQQLNVSKKEIAYTVLDMESNLSHDTLHSIQDDISKLEGVISSRAIKSPFEPGYFRVNNA